MGIASLDGGDAGTQTFTGIDVLVGSPGNDTLTGSQSQPNTMLGGGGNDQLFGGTGIDVLSGDAGDDLLLGDLGDDTLDGGGDDDVLRPVTGSDSIVGGTGIDLVSYIDLSIPVSASLLSQTATIMSAVGTQTLDGVESLMGGAANDVLTAMRPRTPCPASRATTC